MSSKRVWRASEALAISYLESQGFNIFDVHRKLIVDGVEVSDLDIVAEKDGVVYAVEVKAGNISVDDLRQAYVNAKLAGLKPMIIGRGVADDRVEVVARELGVHLNILPDIIVASVNELREAVYEAVYSAINDILSHLTVCVKLTEEDNRLLSIIASGENIADIAGKAGISEKEVVSIIARLVDKGILPKGSPLKTLILLARIIAITCRYYK
ncbi:MAG: restriction endonuclease, SacI family [Acidilobaceae archaeon]